MLLQLCSNVVAVYLSAQHSRKLVRPPLRASYYGRRQHSHTGTELAVMKDLEKANSYSPYWSHVETCVPRGTSFSKILTQSVPFIIQSSPDQSKVSAKFSWPILGQCFLSQFVTSCFEWPALWPHQLTTDCTVAVRGPVPVIVASGQMTTDAEK